MTFHPHGRLLAVASVDGTTKVWDGSTAACRVEFVGHVDRVSAIAFCHNGARLMTASDDGTVKLCRTEDEYFTAVDWPNFAVNEIDFSSDSGLLAWTGYPTSGGVPGYTGIVELPALAADFLNGAAGVFADLQFLSTPRLFLGVGAGGGRAEISVTQSPVVPRGFPRPADQTGWMPRLTATSDGAISVWGSCYPLHVADAQNNVKLLGADETAEVIELRINPAHERELIVASDKTIAVWDLQARRCTSRWAMPAPTKGFDFIDRTTIAVGGADEVLRIVDVPHAGNFVAELPSNDGADQQRGHPPQRANCGAGTCKRADLAVGPLGSAPTADARGPPGQSHPPDVLSQRPVSGQRQRAGAGVYLVGGGGQRANAVRRHRDDQRGVDGGARGRGDASRPCGA